MKFSLATCFTALAATASFAAAVPTQLASRANTVTTSRVANSDPAVTYTGDWTRLANQGPANGIDPVGGTLAYTHDGNGEVSFLFGTGSSGFLLRTGKKADRGFFDIYLGDELIYVGDAHGECTSECSEADYEIVFAEGSLKPQDENTRMRIVNREYDSRVGGTPYLAFNYLDRYLDV
ncbi:uncharacterized protein JCM10292_000488 [Rhodotorula paludigena]|uniref:uncharacterized protein n=1 Tax=Rhodotorula paludigena TaxID=86838 RepID=UPI003180948D